MQIDVADASALRSKLCGRAKVVSDKVLGAAARCAQGSCPGVVRYFEMGLIQRIDTNVLGLEKIT